MGTPTPNMPAYYEYYRAHRWDVPDRFNFGRDVVDRWAADRGRTALLWEDSAGRSLRYTFWDIKTLSDRLGGAMQALGVARGDRVLVLLPRLPEWMVAMIACVKIGAIAIPTTDMVQPKDIHFRIEHAEAVAVITTGEGAPKVEAAAAAGCQTLAHRILVGDPVTGDGEERPGWHGYHRLLQEAPRRFEAADTRSAEPAVMYYTSGTTGNPKGVLHSHAATFAWREEAYCWLNVRPDRLHWCTTDTGWSKAGTSIIFGPWSWGTPVLMYHGPFDPRQRLSLLEKYEVNTFCAAPTEYGLMANEDLTAYDLRALEHCVSAGEPMQPTVIQRWKEGSGHPIFDGYGLTEALMACHNYLSVPVRPGSMGKPLPGYELAVIDGNGDPLPANTEGDLAIRRPNPCIAIGFWKNEEAYRAAFRGDWFVTGDQAWVDQDGYFWFVGRGDDVILSAGYRIGPFEIENALATHPAVLESAAVGSPNRVRGEIVKSFVVLRSGYAPSEDLARELQDHVKAVTAPYKYPRAIEFVDSLPKTVSGKIRRKELKMQEVARVGEFMGIRAPGKERDV